MNNQEIEDQFFTTYDLEGQKLYFSSQEDLNDWKEFQRKLFEAVMPKLNLKTHTMEQIMIYGTGGDL